MDLTTTKDIATIAAPFTGVIVNAFLKPALDEFAEFFKKGKKNLVHLVANEFDNYLIRSYEKQWYIKTLVFQNRQIPLNKIYIPLTVVNFDSGETIKVDSYPKKLLPTNNKILLVDTAGMGKSTLSKYLFLKAIEEGNGIPIFLELRQLKSGKSIVDLIHDDISSIDEVFDKEFLLKLIARGDFVFFFDGFDEIPLKEREYATQHLQDFIAKASKNQFLLTSRQDAALASFADFQRFVINPLRQHEAFALLTKLDTIGGGIDSGETAESLIEKLKQEHHNANLKSFLSNPLLVSLLYKAYDFKPTLPMRVDMFYRQVYEALFENHDLSKGGAFVRDKKSKLNIDDFSRVLRVLAIRTVGLGKVEYSLDELLGYVSEARSKCLGLSFAESDFVKDLTGSVPLFVVDGLYYRWSHKSFQEYFAALFIAQDAKGQADIYLKRFVDSKEQQRFANILELYYDLDITTFNRAVTKELINDFAIFEKGPQYSAKYPGIDKADLQIRKSLSFSRRYLLFSERSVTKLAGDIVNSEPSKAHNAMRQYIEQEDLLSEFERVGSSTIYPLGSGMVAINAKWVVIMEILYRKQNPLVVSMSAKMQKRQVRSYGTITADTFTRDGEPKFISDNPDDTLNSHMNFVRVNILLATNDRIKIGIDETEAAKALAEIDRIADIGIDDFLGSI